MGSVISLPSFSLLIPTVVMPRSGPVRTVVRQQQNKDVYEVEEILGAKRFGQRVQVLVKWVGYPLKDINWEPLDNCAGSSGSLKIYQPLIEHIQASLKRKEPSSSSLAAENGVEYDVEDIVGIWWNYKTKKIYYTIKWKNFPHRSNTDEPQDHVKDCDGILKPFQSIIDHLERLAPKITSPFSRKRKTPEPESSSKTTPVKSGRKGRKSYAEDEEEDKEEEENQQVNGGQEEDDEDQEEEEKEGAGYSRPGPKSKKRAGRLSRAIKCSPEKEERPGPKSPAKSGSRTSSRRRK